MGTEKAKLLCPKLTWESRPAKEKVCNGAAKILQSADHPIDLVSQVLDLAGFELDLISLDSSKARKRLLIVDDEWINRQILVGQLTSLPNAEEVIEWREAENGQEALALWRKWKPHLILMDISMPLLNGDEATRQIRLEQERDPVDPSPIIIAVTGMTKDNEHQALRVAGCDAVLSKSFQKNEFVALMKEHLGLQVHAGESAEV